jgi:hypothetical protein
VLSQFNGSLIRALLSLFPELDLDPKKFLNLPSKSLLFNSSFISKQYFSALSAGHTK